MLLTICFRHPRSLYTRPQRIIIAVDLVLTTMLISMLFLGVEDGEYGFIGVIFPLIDLVEF